jgi:hypothetical protein
MTNLEEVRFIIDDKNKNDFSDAEINHFFNQVNSVNYVVYKLCNILIIKLRNQLLEADTTGTEDTRLASLTSRMRVLQAIQNEYKELYENEDSNDTGRYISTVKPTIAGGDI